jgi:outer membrane protein assembly factor BamB
MLGRMASYRNAATTTPLLASMGKLLFATVPETGQKLWERDLGTYPGRIALVGDAVFVASDGPNHGDPSAIHVLDLATGAPRGVIDSEMPLKAVVTHGAAVFFGGPRGVIAVTADGRVLWRAVLEVVTKSAWSGDVHDLVARDGGGRELWRIPECRGSSSSLLATVFSVAQPDFDT